MATSSGFAEIGRIVADHHCDALSTKALDDWTGFEIRSCDLMGPSFSERTRLRPSPHLLRPRHESAWGARDQWPSSRGLSCARHGSSSVRLDQINDGRRCITTSDGASGVGHLLAKLWID